MIARILLVVGGCILLLPGLCSVAFSSMIFTGNSIDTGVLLIWGIGILIGLGGVKMIYDGLRK